MLMPTKPHKEILNNNKNIYSIKIGKIVPPNAVSLAYYYNLGANTANKNILAVDAPKNSIDHIECMDERKVVNLLKKDESVFPKLLDYKDNDGYTGIMYQTNVKWIENEKLDTKYSVIQKTYTNLIEQKIPTSIEHSEGNMRGTLILKNDNYIATEFAQKDINIPTKRNFIKTITKSELKESFYSFPKSYTIDEDGYNGSIPLVESSVRYAEVNNDSNIKNIVIRKEYDGINPNIPQTIDYEYNGKIYKIPITSQVNNISDAKHYGVCRYWGYSSTGLYGTADRKYKVHSDGGKGYFKDNKPPAQIANRYGHYPDDLLMSYKNFTIKSAYTGWKELNYGTNNINFFYLDETVTKIDGKVYNLGKYTSYWNPNVMIDSPKSTVKNLLDGMEWTYDLGKAAYYGGANNLTHGGIIWASQYISKDKVWPPIGYEKDPIWKGDKHMTFVSSTEVYQNGKVFKSGSKVILENKEYNVSDLIKINNYPINKVIMSDPVIKRNCIFKDVTRCNSTLAYPGNQQYSKMTIMFYKGKIQRTSVIYSTNIVIDAGITYTASANYEGELTKTYSTSETIPVKWDCYASYEGIIKYHYFLYDGISTYRGIMIKRNNVGNINKENIEELLMYVDQHGYLNTKNNNKIIDGQNFAITDVFYDKTPLYYSYMLSNYIYELNGPDETGIYKGNIIKLIDENNVEIKNPYLYKIKLIPTEHENLYKGYVFTSFKTYTNKKIYCIYNSCKLVDGMVDFNSFKPGDKELIFVQEAYQLNKDYVIEKNANYRQSSIKVFDYLNFKDTRKKVSISYIVKTTDNSYVSKPINANVINIKYSFKAEKKEFFNNNYIVSPTYENIYLSASDILIRDYNITASDLKNKQIVVDFYNSSINENNHNKVFLYTNQDGSSPVYALTSEDTGFYDINTGEYTKMYDFDTMNKDGGNISSIFSVINKDVDTIKLVSPDESNNLLSWYCKIKFGSFTQVLEQYNTKIKIIYSVPEYINQKFSSIDGEPYRYVENELAKIINSNEIKISKTPIRVRYNSRKDLLNLLVYKKNNFDNNEILTVKSWSYDEGIITLEETLNDTDNVYVSYEYEEQYYIYRGYYEENNFIDLNINPSIYYDYLDTTTIPYIRKNTSELFNKDIYFFIKPKQIKNLLTNEILVDNDKVIYHKFGNSEPNGENDLLIGKLLIRHNTSLKSTILVDTRQIGGGVLETIYDNLRSELEVESNYYFDIGYYDGEAYQENAVIIIRLDKLLLKENGGNFTKSEIENIINKWIVCGVYAIIEYIDAIDPKENPNNNLIIKKLNG